MAAISGYARHCKAALASAAEQAEGRGESPGDWKYDNCNGGLEGRPQRPICFTDRNYMGRSIVRDLTWPHHVATVSRPVHPLQLSPPGTSQHC